MTNPYQPIEVLPSDSQDSGDRIVFNGDVTLHDMATLIHVPMIIRVMRVVGVIVLVPFTVLPTVFVIHQPGGLTQTFPVIAVSAGLAACLLFADRYLSRFRRARRLVKKQPTLVGPCRGELNAQGIK